MNYSEIRKKILSKASVLSDERRKYLELSDERKKYTEVSLKRLGIDSKSQFGKIYLTFNPSIFWDLGTPSYSELDSAYPAVLDGHPLPDPDQTISPIEGTYQFVRETWELPENYIPFTSTEGEGCYLYDKETEAVYDFDLADWDKLMSGELKPKWSDFYHFIDYYLS